ncbi:AAA family ATPase [Paenibacillus agricola]|uniref:Nuclease SbcCD subunit C n=1 Tax=Paenibacillus agricola TaxID=2716264 RepID=A0ABX0IYZ4_9BACL|nr:SMC family ATPase [Paenibacillus agricola]NHN29189.1 SMC family ATPase [Paenibacillus agricola]
MRPLRLVMTALGPYKEKETIDFSRMEHHRLFVISGNTGAGKTTIFDAICYALYDTASGEDRYETRMLRSHFADEQTPTTVEFDFAIGSRSYRVVRQLAYRKGNNKNETPPTAELYEISSGTAVPCVDRFNIKDINVKLQQIIGLTKDQFSQIVMLPQGEFRKLLTSDTENKEDILRRIFRTELYQKVEDRFRQLVREKKDVAERMRAELEFTVRQISVSLPIREESELAQTLGQEVHNVVQVMQALDSEAVHYTQIAEQAGLARIALDKQVEQDTEAYHKAEALNERFADLAKKQLSLAQMEERQPDIERDEGRLGMADKAAGIEPYEEQSRRARDQLLSLTSKLGLKASEVERATLAKQAAEQKLLAEQAREGERKAAEQALQQLQATLPIVKSLHERQAEIVKLEEGEKAAIAKQAATDKAWAQALVDKKQLAEQIKLLEQEVAALPAKRERLTDLRLRGSALNETRKLLLQLDEWSKHQHAGQASYTALVKQYEQEEALWIEGQASLLAAHLHNGMPCPVCGSTEHPDKVQPEGTIPTREQLDAVKKQLQAAQEEFSRAEAQVAAASSSIAEKRTELLEIGEFNEDIHTAYQQVVTEGKQCKEEVDQLAQQAERLVPVKAALEQLDHQMGELTQEKQILADRLGKLTLERSLKQAALSKDLESIAEELRSYPSLTSKLQQQQKLVEANAAAWKHAQEQHAQTQLKWAQEQATFAQMEQQLEEAAAQSEAAHIRFMQEIAKCGFTAEADYLAAKLPEPARFALKEQLQQFKAAMSALQQAMAELAQALAGKERADVVLLLERLTALKEQLEQAAERHKEARAYLQAAASLRLAVEQTSGRLIESERSYGEAVDIHQVLKGDNALRMSFERYILIEFFEQILQAANIRLRGLSNGQFELLRSERIEKHNRPSGLGLDVFDSYTGQNRDVKTLSGGEKFNASLCLALGMTDVIQANQGGISIEMMFIDEGFGTLDEESLNKAIETLIDLQKMGRMIGVISHVAEIKASFPAVLEVTKSREGYSHVELILK